MKVRERENRIPLSEIIQSDYSFIYYIVGRANTHQSTPQLNEHVRTRYERHEPDVHRRIGDRLALEPVGAYLALPAHSRVPDGNSCT